jgi:hypothetical protein
MVPPKVPSGTILTSTFSVFLLSTGSSFDSVLILAGAVGVHCINSNRLSIGPRDQILLYCCRRVTVPFKYGTELFIDPIVSIPKNNQNTSKRV